MYEENTPTEKIKKLPNKLQVNGKDPKPLLPEISLEKASFKWLVEATEPTLDKLDLSVARGSLLAVIGPVGAGKVNM